MKILLTAVNAKYIHSNLAVYCLKAAAGRYEPLVQLAEYTINHQADDIFQAIYREKPDLLLFSCYIWNMQLILETAENIRKVLPATKIWAGGPEVSYDGEAFLEAHPFFDGVMVGEGERTFRELLEHYVDGTAALEDIPGLVFRSDHIQKTPPRPYLETLDEIPFVYRDLEKFENRIIYYESSRGCPFSCSYCLSSIDKRVRFRSLDLVKRELGFFLENKVPQVKFVDRTFNCRHERTMEIWQFIQEHDNGVTNFHFEIAADLLREDELELLSRMRPGLVQLEIGVQTVNERTLEAIQRTAKFETIADPVKKAAAGRNVHQHLDLIAGLPYEDFDSFRHSFDAVYRLHPQALQLGFLKVLKGSEMAERASEYGIIHRSLPPYEVLETRWISCDELLRLKDVEEMLEMYYNSQQFRYTMEALEQFYESPFDLYGELADYYKDHGLTGKAWSRMQRFLWLKNFIQEKAETSWQKTDGEENEEIRRYFTELLTLDFYLRENGKSRPEWAEDLTKYKEQMNQFYRKEEETYAHLPQYRGMTWKQMMRMTHLEHFSSEQFLQNASVFDGMEDGEQQGGWLLFDYGKRDPLTYDSTVKQVILPLE